MDKPKNDYESKAIYKLKLLIIEDEINIVNILKIILEDYYIISYAETLEKTLIKLSKEKFDISILDLNLPDSAGIETIKEVTTRFPELPIIIFTGIDDPSITLSAIQAGAQDYLVKGDISEDIIRRSIRYAIERKKIEMILKEKEERYKSLFENARDAVFIADIQTGIIIDANVQAEKLLKKSKDQIIGMHQTELHPPEISEYSNSAFKDPYSLKNPVYIDILTSENEKIPVEINASIMTLPNGKKIIQGIFRDITERKKYEEAIKESEYKWRSLAENSAEYVVQTDLDGNIQFANKDGIIPRDKAVGASIFTNVSESFKQNIKDCLEKVKNNKKADKCYFEYIRSKVKNSKNNDSKISLNYSNDNNRIIFESHISPLIRSEKVVGFIISSLDVTEHRKIEKAIRDKEEQYRNIVENSNDMIWVMDNEGKYIFFNKKAENLSGYNLENLNHNFASLILKEDLPKITDAVHHALKGNSQHYDFSFISSSKKKITISANSIPVYSRGKIVCISSFGRDITELKGAEEEIKKTLEKLDKSRKEIEQFAYIASHDLQEPLRSISSFTRLLANRYKEKISPEADEFIDYILNGTIRMQNMINDLLTLSRVERTGNKFKTTNVNEVLKHVLSNLHNLIIENKVTINIEDMPIVNADESQLIQLFQNLIENGIKFHNKGTLPQIDISAIQDSSKNQWIFSVKDNGIGIDPKNFNKLFVIFHRLHSKDEYPGTGIGLAICKKIVDRHEGEIWVESKPGYGSTFFFSIPIREDNFIN